MNINPNKKIVKKALFRELVIKQMRDAISEGREVSHEHYLMDALIGVYRELYHDKEITSPCCVQEYIDRIRCEGLIVDDDKTIVSNDGLMGEVELGSGVWRIQRDIIDGWLGIGRNCNHDFLIAYLRGVGNSVHCRIVIGEHFLDFLHVVDDWIPLINEELHHYFITAGKLEQIENIGRITFGSLVDDIFENSEFRYKAEYHTEENVVLFVWLSNGVRERFFLTLEELSRESSRLMEDIRSLDQMVKRYGAKFSLGHRT